MPAPSIYDKALFTPEESAGYNSGRDTERYFQGVRKSFKNTAVDFSLLNRSDDDIIRDAIDYTKKTMPAGFDPHTGETTEEFNRSVFAKKAELTGIKQQELKKHGEAKYAAFQQGAAELPFFSYDDTQKNLMSQDLPWLMNRQQAIGQMLREGKIAPEETYKYLANLEGPAGADEHNDLQFSPETELEISHKTANKYYGPLKMDDRTLFSKLGSALTKGGEMVGSGIAGGLKGVASLDTTQPEMPAMTTFDTPEFQTGKGRATGPVIPAEHHVQNLADWHLFPGVNKDSVSKLFTLAGFKKASTELGNTVLRAWQADGNMTEDTLPGYLRSVKNKLADTAIELTKKADPKLLGDPKNPSQAFLDKAAAVHRALIESNLGSVAIQHPDITTLAQEVVLDPLNAVYGPVGDIVGHLIGEGASKAGKALRGVAESASVSPQAEMIRSLVNTGDKVKGSFRDVFAYDKAAAEMRAAGHEDTANMLEIAKDRGQFAAEDLAVKADPLVKELKTAEKQLGPEKTKEVFDFLHSGEDAEPVKFSPEQIALVDLNRKTESVHKELRGTLGNRWQGEDLVTKELAGDYVPHRVPAPGKEALEGDVSLNLRNPMGDVHQVGSSQERIAKDPSNFKSSLADQWEREFQILRAHTAPVEQMKETVRMMKKEGMIHEVDKPELAAVSDVERGRALAKIIADPARPKEAKLQAIKDYDDKLAEKGFELQKQSRQDIEQLKKVHQEQTGMKWVSLDENWMAHTVRLTEEPGTAKLGKKTYLMPEVMAEGMQKMHKAIGSKEAPGLAKEIWDSYVRPMGGATRGTMIMSGQWLMNNFATNPFLPYLKDGVKAYEPKMMGKSFTAAVVAAMGGAEKTGLEFTLKNGTTHDVADIVKFFERNKMISTMEETRGLLKSERTALPGSKTLNKIEGAVHTLSKPLGKVNEVLDNQTRFMIGLSELDDLSDKSLAKAARAIQQYAYNPARLSDFEKQVKEGVNFYGWMRFMFPRAVKSLRDHPDRMAIFTKAKNAWQRDKAKAPMQGQELPVNVKGRGAILAPDSMQPPDDEQGRTVMTVDTPETAGFAFLQDITDMFGDSIQEDNVSDKLGIGLYALNYFLNRNSLKGKGPKEAFVGEHLLGRLPAVATAIAQKTMNNSQKGYVNYLLSQAGFQLRMNVAQDFASDLKNSKVLGLYGPLQPTLVKPNQGRQNFLKSMELEREMNR